MSTISRTATVFCSLQIVIFTLSNSSYQRTTIFDCKKTLPYFVLILIIYDIWCTYFERAHQSNLPDLKKWNRWEVEFIFFLFYACSEANRKSSWTWVSNITSTIRYSLFELLPFSFSFSRQFSLIFKADVVRWNKMNSLVTLQLCCRQNVPFIIFYEGRWWSATII